ncbi:MAG: hypothetical protein WD768_06205, partial [Phycisphaeraceae bacterium]
MDDTRTNETLDALADLFLTGVSTPPRKGPQRIPPKSREEEGGDDVAASKPSRPATHTAVEELDGPESIRLGSSHLAPRDGDSPRPAREDHSKPAMRLTSDYDDAPPVPVHVEAVFLGNLPGFGGPWLTQYAFHLAQQRGPVGILHLSGDQIDLELVTAERQAIRAGIDEPLRSVAEGDVLLKRLHRLSRDLDMPVANWLIHLPSPPREEDLPAACSQAHWTILCGADDAAIAGATRTVQQLVEGAAAQAEATQTAPLPRLIGVAVMGSDEVKAREAIGKFNA